MATPRDGYHDLFAQVPEDLWQALRAEAEAEERSATAQLIYILRGRYGRPEPPRQPPAPRPGRKRKGD